MEANEQQNRTSRPWTRYVWYLGAVCVIACAAFLGGWWLGERSPGQKEPDMVKLDMYNDEFQQLLDTTIERRSLKLPEVEEITRIRFPKGTKLLNAVRVAWQEDTLYAKLEMNESSMNQLMNSPKFAGKFSETDTHGMFNTLGWPARWMSWWNPDAVILKDFLAAEDMVDTEAGSEVSKVLIGEDTMRRGTYLIYLYWVELRH